MCPRDRVPNMVIELSAVHFPAAGIQTSESDGNFENRHSVVSIIIRESNVIANA